MRIIMAIFILGLIGCGEDGANNTCAAGGPRHGYLAGPFGTDVGAVIENLALVAADGSLFALERIHHDGNNRLLLIMTAAGWCGACIEEQPTLQGLYEMYGANGLAVLVALFEDDQFNPADAALAAAWTQQYHVTFPVLADPHFVFDAYYDSTLTPMQMFVDVCSMEILKIGTGSDASAIEAIIEARL
ncbi:MAG: hypothetical protein A2289_03740 [Deltaproteobacteria bacterium RIFOXYA12_FULL_58_15]|nr:MAG: hypothetical protein A2289_03740 [Deltaproteobacteria bacterium RIFOXYA12_FULL_58_15]OGR08481.1 MAG: hypothetical protein A2341_02905 [Deltaproteobacteria bacterium RIFOXYB12_FULL_58_9]